MRPLGSVLFREKISKPQFEKHNCQSVPDSLDCILKAVKLSATGKKKVVLRSMVVTGSTCGGQDGGEASHLLEAALNSFWEVDGII